MLLGVCKTFSDTIHEVPKPTLQMHFLRHGCLVVHTVLLPVGVWSSIRLCGPLVCRAGGLRAVCCGNSTRLHQYLVCRDHQIPHLLVLERFLWQKANQWA